MVSITGDRLLLNWLFVVAMMVASMIVIGGVTRITGSGLSMVEWRPLVGWLPPFSEKEWNRIFDLYQRSPQFVLVNAWMDLEAFKDIFWWEYIHRLWGRLIGIVFILPLVAFWILGRIPSGHARRLIMLLVLGAAQGVVGWWMVLSGLSQEPSVSQYRLALHLGIAFLILGILVWTILGFVTINLDVSCGYMVLHAKTVVISISATIIAGSLVAGMDAGLTYNTFPLMDGGVVPKGYFSISPYWKNIFENAGAVQFNHRVSAAITVLLTVSLLVRCLLKRLPVQQRMVLHILAGLVLLQFALGISTLINFVPAFLAIIHQLMAICLFVNSLLAVWVLKGASNTSY